MKAFILLQLRDKRQVVLGLLAVFALTLPIGIVAAIVGGATPVDAGTFMCLVWGVLGVPVAALAIGANAGAGQRESAAERLLPLGHLRRMGAAFAAASVNFVLLAAAISLGLAGVNLLLDAVDSAVLVGFAMFVTPVAVLGLAFGFVGAYLTGNTVSGLFAGAAATAWASASLVVGAHLTTSANLPFPYAPTFAALAAVIGGAVGLAVAPSFAIERGMRWNGRPLAATLAAAACFIVSGAVCALWTHARIVAERDVFVPRTHIEYWDRVSYDPGLPGRAKGAEGVLLKGVRDDLYWAAPDGSRRMLIAPNEGRFAKAYRTYFSSDLVASGYDGHGLLWVIKREPLPGKQHYFHVWSGDPSAGLKSEFRIQAAEAELRHVGDQLWLTATRFGDTWSVARLTPGMKEPKWKDLTMTAERHFKDQAYLAGGIAKIMPGRSLAFRAGGETRTCRLPKSHTDPNADVLEENDGFYFAEGSVAPVQRLRGGGWFFLVDSGWHSTALVDESCRVLMETDSREFENSLPELGDGSRWMHDGKGAILFTSSDGKKRFRKQLELTKALERAGATSDSLRDIEVLFRTDAGIKLLVGGRYLVDLPVDSAEDLSVETLPWDARSFGAREGAYLLTSKALWYLPNDGGARKYLGPM